jgi:hypothetical protein
MSDYKRTRLLPCVARTLVVALAGAGRIAGAQAPQLSIQDRVAALNSLVADSQAAMERSKRPMYIRRASQGWRRAKPGEPIGSPRI